MESDSDPEKIEQIANCHLGSMRWSMDQSDQIKPIQQKLPNKSLELTLVWLSPTRDGERP
jgi:hypothetical protein